MRKRINSNGLIEWNDSWQSVSIGESMLKEWKWWKIIQRKFYMHIQKANVILHCINLISQT